MFLDPFIFRKYKFVSFTVPSFKSKFLRKSDYFNCDFRNRLAANKGDFCLIGPFMSHITHAQMFCYSKFKMAARSGNLNAQDLPTFACKLTVLRVRVHVYEPSNMRETLTPVGTLHAKVGTC